MEPSGLTVTVRDNKTGDMETAQVAEGDYLLVTCVPCRLDSHQNYPTTGTVVLTIKGHRPTTRAGGLG